MQVSKHKITKGISDLLIPLLTIVLNEVLQSYIMELDKAAITIIIPWS